MDMATPWLVIQEKRDLFDDVTHICINQKTERALCERRVGHAVIDCETFVEFGKLSGELCQGISETIPVLGAAGVATCSATIKTGVVLGARHCKILKVNLNYDCDML